MYDALQPQDHVEVDLDGTVVEGDLKPSSDTAGHLYFYRHRDDVEKMHYRYTHVCGQ